MKNFKRFGVMIDCSRNAVMKPGQIKKFIDDISAMGYNVLELYLEDTFRIESEPYFGYLRGGYSKETLQELDAYARGKNVELVPAIQTLAHFTNLVKLPHYADIVDVGDILMIGDEKTYALIDKMFATLREAFSSNLVNIGMDEAHMAGLGQYLYFYFFLDQYDLILYHRERVAEIAGKYGFNAHAWSDMLFKLGNNGKYYDKGVKLSPLVIARVPGNVSPVYWDYYHTEIDDYDAMMSAHKAFGRESWFAGGAWCWGGFAPFNGYTMRSMKAALTAAKRNRVENVLITMWGDNGKECSFFALLPSLYAVSRYADGVEDEEEITQGFEQLFGIPFEAFTALDLPNLLPVKHEDLETPCKALLYCDPFLGILDDLVGQEGRIPYGEYAKAVDEAGKKAGEYRYLFDFISSLCSVLELKYDFGVRVRKRYASGERAALTPLVGELDEIVVRLDRFYGQFKRLWFIENEPFGFEVHEARIGGLRLRLSSCRDRLKDYVEGKTERIEELECEILPYGEKPTLYFNVYRNLVSVSEL